MKLTIVGGTYEEICLDPSWNEMYGSGFRAAHALSNHKDQIILHTSIGQDDYDDLIFMAKALGIPVIANKVKATSSFVYQYPLLNPLFHLPADADSLVPVRADNVLQFGMIEGNRIVQASRVVYDPQSPENPKSFWSNGSTTEELIWVCNLQEAIALSGFSDIDSIKKFLFVQERVNAAVIKRGTDGATLIQKDKPDIVIPAFITKTVWPIGTGDVFSSVLGYSYLINNDSLQDACEKASLATAYYSESMLLPIPTILSNLNYKEFQKNTTERKKAYLAGPFFSMSQRWMIQQLRDQLSAFGLETFSPYHDVGIGEAHVVAPLDIEAINKCDIVVALVEELDAGTLFEIGYAKAKGIPVIAYAEKPDPDDLTMLVGTGCEIITDFSTLIYRTVWAVYNE